MRIVIEIEAPSYESAANLARSAASLLDLGYHSGRASNPVHGSMQYAADKPHTSGEAREHVE